MIHYSLPLSEYHGSTAISASKVKAYADMRCDADYHARYLTGPKLSEPTEALAIGQAFEDRCQRGFTDAMQTLTAANCWGKKPETIQRNIEAASDQIETMFAAFDDHPDSGAIRRRGIPQVTFRAVIGGVTLQCRPDWYLPNGLDGVSDPLCVDLKTCQDLAEFPDDLVKFRYHWQAHINRMIVRRALAIDACVDESEVPPVGLELFAVDKLENPLAVLFELSPVHYEQAERDLISTDEHPGHLRRLMNAYRSNTWESVPRKTTAKPPRWMERSVQS